jgi:signal transduction histidine kinase/CheY-like chemotaxis protein
MNMDKDTKKTSEPEKLVVIVKTLKPSGALVDLPGGESAFLPGHEMFPDFKPYEDFRERGKSLRGKKIEAVEFQDPIRSDQKLVSHIRATNDPWKNVSTWSDGDIKVMEVDAKTKDRVMGIIDPGIRAEVLLNPAWEVLKSESWKRFGTPLVGDEIAGIFHENKIDNQNRIVILDYANIIQSHMSIKKFLSLYDIETITVLNRLNNLFNRNVKNKDEFEIFKNLRGIGNILLVDNDTVFLNSLREFLEGRARRVIACETYGDALREIKNYTDDLDMAIIDIHIPKYRKPYFENGDIDIKDHLGLELARLLRKEHNGCSVIVITGEDFDPGSKKFKEFGDLEISGFFAKPFGVQNLYQALAAAAGPPRPIVNLLPGSENPKNIKPDKDTSYRAALQNTLDLLRYEIKAEGIVFFSIHPISYVVSIEAFSNPFNAFYFHQHMYKLPHSPVRDTAIDGEAIFSLDALSENEFPKHRWLQRAYNYRSCIGVPVRPQLASPMAYALFAFHRKPRHFNRNHFNIVRFAAREIKYILDMNAMNNELQQVKPFELMGKIYGSMAHELTSLFSDEFLLSKLEEQIAAKNRGASLKNIRILQEQSKRASDILHTFRSMARGQRDTAEDFCIEEILPKIIFNFKGKAEYSNIEIRFEKEITNSCKVKMQKSGFELIIYNLLLNAVQQIERVRFLRNYKGLIQIQLTDKTDEMKARWGIIKIQDNGPGIHKQDFNRIFDIHFTTKEQGCGMGLDISRSIARGLKIGDRTGELFVSRSILLIGTCFEIKLPLQ